tara:strand:+ start:18909 stop:19046 length:138 start_codon:yes stop_codon:yes gene_type:complete
MKGIFLQALGILAEKLCEHVIDYFSAKGRERIKERKKKKLQEKEE